MTQHKGILLHFGQLGDGSVIKPYVASGQYLSTLWLKVMQKHVEAARLAMSAIKGRFWCTDHTFKIAKFVRDADGYQHYLAVLTIMNELGEVVAQFFTHTTPCLRSRRDCCSSRSGTLQEKACR